MKLRKISGRIYSIRFECPSDYFPKKRGQRNRVIKVPSRPLFISKILIIRLDKGPTYERLLVSPQWRTIPIFNVNTPTKYKRQVTKIETRGKPKYSIVKEIEYFLLDQNVHVFCRQIHRKSNRWESNLCYLYEIIRSFPAFKEELARVLSIVANCIMGTIVLVDILQTIFNGKVDYEDWVKYCSK